MRSACLLEAEPGDLRRDSTVGGLLSPSDASAIASAMGSMLAMYSSLHSNWVSSARCGGRMATLERDSSDTDGEEQAEE